MGNEEDKWTRVEDSKQGKEAKRIEVTYKGITKLLPFNAKFYDNLAKFMEGQLP